MHTTLVLCEADSVAVVVYATMFVTWTRPIPPALPCSMIPDLLAAKCAVCTHGRAFHSIAAALQRQLHSIHHAARYSKYMPEHPRNPHLATAKQRGKSIKERKKLTLWYHSLQACSKQQLCTSCGENQRATNEVRILQPATAISTLYC